MFVNPCVDKTITFMEENSEKMFERNYGKLIQISERFMLQEKFIRINAATSSFICVKSKKAYNLANLLTKRGYNVKVKSVCEGLIYEIIYDFATLFTFYKITNENFSVLKQQESGTIPILSLRNQLIIIYQDLYNPTKISSYEDNLNLKNLVIKNLELKLEKKVVAGKIKTFAVKNKFKPPEFKNEIFIGKTAVEFILGEEFEFPGPIEIISADVPATVEFISKHYKVDSAETVDFPILIDYGLKKTVVVINKKPEIVIYNSATYELIPFFTPRKNFRIASIYVVCRFILINIFQLKIRPDDKDKDIITMLQLQHYMVIKTDTYTLPIDEKLDDIARSYYGQYVEPRILFSELCPKGRFYTPFEMLARGGKLINF